MRSRAPGRRDILPALRNIFLKKGLFSTRVCPAVIVSAKVGDFFVKKFFAFLVLICLCAPLSCAADLSHDAVDCGIVYTAPEDYIVLMRRNTRADMLDAVNETQAGVLEIMKKYDIFLWMETEYGEMSLYLQAAEEETDEPHFLDRWSTIEKAVEEYGGNMNEAHLVTINNVTYLSYDLVYDDFEGVYYETCRNGKWYDFEFVPDTEEITGDFRNHAFSLMHGVRFYDEDFSALAALRERESIYYSKEDKIGLICPDGWSAYPGEGDCIGKFSNQKKMLVYFERFSALDPIIALSEATEENTAALFETAGITATSDIEEEWFRGSNFYRVEAERAIDGETVPCCMYFFEFNDKMYGMTYTGAQNAGEYWDFIAMMGSLSRGRAPEKAALEPLRKNGEDGIMLFQNMFSWLHLSNFFGEQGELRSSSISRSASFWSGYPASSSACSPKRASRF